MHISHLIRVVASDFNVVGLVAGNRRFSRPGHSVLCVIRTKADLPWPADHAIDGLDAAGLRVRGIVRLKISSLDSRLVEKKLGLVGETDRTGFVDGMQVIDLDSTAVMARSLATTRHLSWP